MRIASIFIDKRKSQVVQRGSPGHLGREEHNGTGPIGQVNSKHWVTQWERQRGQRCGLCPQRVFKVSLTVCRPVHKTAQCPKCPKRSAKECELLKGRFFSAWFLPPRLPPCLPPATIYRVVWCAQSMDSTGPGCELQLCHWLTVWPRTSYLTSLRLSFLKFQGRGSIIKMK